MQVPSFEIFHYQDLQPAGVDPHHHDFYEVYFFLDGSMDYQVEGHVYSLRPGDLLLINPMEIHQPRVNSKDAFLERIVLWIDKAYLESLGSGDSSLTRCFDNSLPTHRNLLRLSPSQQSNITHLLASLIRERYEPSYGSDLYAKGLLLQFMVELNRVATEVPNSVTPKGTQLISDVIAYINDNYQQKLSMDLLASKFYVSKYYLGHEFSRVVGTSVYRYIMLKRLLIARQMLLSGQAPSQVYSQCGFGDYANFYRAFRAQYGTSPGECSGTTT